jgi:raffinose/stachyose/melibiose transport system permease protein
MWSVMLALARPAMVFAAIGNTVPAWNDFCFPLVFLQNERLQTLPQGLTVFMGDYNTERGLLFAGLTLASLPLTFVYILLSRHVLFGMARGRIEAGLRLNKGAEQVVAFGAVTCDGHRLTAIII